MSKFRIEYNTSREEWESFLAKSVSGNLPQSFDYGEVMKMSDQHNRVMRLCASNDGGVVGLVQAISYRNLGFGARLNAGDGYEAGAVVSLEDEENILRELMSSLEKTAARKRVIEGFIFRPSIDKVLEHMNYTLSAVANLYRVALQKTAEDLWKSIAHNKRRNVKKALEKGAEVIQTKSYDALVSFYEMYKASSERAGFRTYPFNYYNSYFKIFSASDKVRIFLTIFKDQPAAGVFIVVHGDTAYALAAGSKKDFLQVRPNDLLHWKAMDWARGEGLSWYHFGGVYDPLPTENSPGWSLWRWKREWNGQLKKYYVYHKVYMPKFKKFILTPYDKISSTVRKIGF